MNIHHPLAGIQLNYLSETFLFSPEPVHYALGKLVVPWSWDVDTKLSLEQHGTLQPRIPELKQPPCPRLPINYECVLLCPVRFFHLKSILHISQRLPLFAELLTHVSRRFYSGVFLFAIKCSKCIAFHVSENMLRPKSNAMTKLFS